MNFETIKIEKDNRGVATLTLMRGDKHNALNAHMIEELTIAVKDLADDSDVRIVVLAGEGKSFCAGGDLSWMQEQFHAARDQRMREARKLAYLLRNLNILPKPLICRVHGNAFGGGLGMMSVCDYVIAEESVRFGLTETKLGLIPATIGPYVVARMGEGKARQVFMSGALFSAEKAKELGLVSEIVSETDLDRAIEKAIAPYLETAPRAVAAAKDLARSLGPIIDEQVIEDTVVRLADVWEGGEAHEGVGAFFEKRKPGWVA